MRTNRLLLAALLPAFLLCGGAAAQDVPLDLEIGYRITDVSGNEEMFRSQLNEREGFQIRSLSYGARGMKSLRQRSPHRLHVNR